MSTKGGASAEARARFEVHAREHRDDLIAFLLRRARSRSEAEEFAQEALFRAWNGFARFDESRPFGPWVTAIAARIVVDARRRRGWAPRTAEDLDLDELEAPRGESASEGGCGASDAVWRLAATHLDDTQRRGLWLRYAEERSVAEVARVLGKAPGATRVYLHRARRRLALLIGSAVSLSAVAWATWPGARPSDELMRIERVGQCIELRLDEARVAALETHARLATRLVEGARPAVEAELEALEQDAEAVGAALLARLPRSLAVRVGRPHEAPGRRGAAGWIRPSPCPDDQRAISVR